LLPYHHVYFPHKLVLKYSFFAGFLFHDSIIRKVLGETPVEDYPEGDSDCYFSTETIDVSGIAPSSLANSGMLHSNCFANTKIVLYSVRVVFAVSLFCTNYLIFDCTRRIFSMGNDFFFETTLIPAERTT
jgi:hypothetical protein